MATAYPSFLIVEDDIFKARRLSVALSKNFVGSNVVVAKSVSSGLSEIVANDYSAILLDMSLSTYDIGPREGGGRPQNFGGATVLQHMRRRGVTTPVVVVTQYPGFERGHKTLSLDDVRAELSNEFGNVFKGLIHYDSRGSSWEVALVDLLNGTLGHADQ